VGICKTTEWFADRGRTLQALAELRALVSLEALKAGAEREEWPARERARRRIARETLS
jgi:hypothetical protein